MEHYKASVGEDGIFLENAGVLMDVDKPKEGNFSSGGDFKTALHAYNVALALVARNRSIALAFFMEFMEFRSGLYYFDVAEHGGSWGGGYSNTVTSKNSSITVTIIFPIFL